MNKLIWPFAICYFLSFDAMARNTVAGYIAFMGSTIGASLILFNYNYPKQPNIKK
jgi:hypothetical protein